MPLLFLVLIGLPLANPSWVTQIIWVWRLGGHSHVPVLWEAEMVSDTEADILCLSVLRGSTHWGLRQPVNRTFTEPPLSPLLRFWLFVTTWEQPWADSSNSDDLTCSHAATRLLQQRPLGGAPDYWSMCGVEQTYSIFVYEIYIYIYCTYI